VEVQILGFGHPHHPEKFKDIVGIAAEAAP
jgi:hypothetical protein